MIAPVGSHCREGDYYSRLRDHWNPTFLNVKEILYEGMFYVEMLKM